MIKKLTSNSNNESKIDDMMHQELNFISSSMIWYIKIHFAFDINVQGSYSIMKNIQSLCYAFLYIGIHPRTRTDAHLIVLTKWWNSLNVEGWEQLVYWEATTSKSEGNFIMSYRSLTCVCFLSIDTMSDEQWNWKYRREMNWLLLLVTRRKKLQYYI